jgi:hypothetical protein
VRRCGAYERSGSARIPVGPGGGRLPDRRLSLPDSSQRLPAPGTVVYACWPDGAAVVCGPRVQSPLGAHKQPARRRARPREQVGRGAARPPVAAAARAPDPTMTPLHERSPPLWAGSETPSDEQEGRPRKRSRWGRRPHSPLPPGASTHRHAECSHLDRAHPWDRDIRRQGKRRDTGSARADGRLDLTDTKDEIPRSRHRGLSWVKNARGGAEQRPAEGGSGGVLHAVF